MVNKFKIVEEIPAIKDTCHSEKGLQSEKESKSKDKCSGKPQAVF